MARPRKSRPKRQTDPMDAFVKEFERRHGIKMYRRGE